MMPTKPSSDDDLLKDAPCAEGWAWTRVSNLGEFGEDAVKTGPFGAILKSKEFVPSGVPILAVGNVQSGRLNLEDARVDHVTEGKATDLSDYRVRVGDVLFTRSGTIGRSAVVPRSADGWLMSYHLLRVRADQHLVNPQYLYFVFSGCEASRRYTNESVIGTTRPGINTQILEDLPVPLPPRPEQDRIVAKCEELRSNIYSARNRLSRVLSILKHFRQAVLAAACSGRLTEDWRRTRSADCLSTKNLIKILAEQCKHADVEWHNPCFDNRNREALPDGWNYAALGVLGTWASGGTPSKSKPEYWSHGKYPWVSPKDMKADFITDSQDHLTPLGVAELKIVAKDSILFVVRGMILAHTFPVGIAMRELTINQDIRAVTLHSGLVPKYLLWALQREAMSILFAVRESTHGTRRLESETLKAWPMPIPPSDEQEEIVRRIECLFNLSKTIERHVSSASSHSEKLAQSVLAKAFRGDLVPTEAELARREGREYEPASVLLERMRAERANHAQTSQSPKRRLRKSSAHV